MEPTTATWRDLTFGRGTDYRIRELEGWEELPAPRYDKLPRARAHGAHPTPVWADERIVTLQGWCWTDTARDTILKSLRARLTFDGGVEPLTVTVAGRTLTAGAQLLAARAMLLRGEWGIGRFGWLAQWRCPDPLRYGPPVTVDTGLPSGGGGLTYPLTYPLDYGPLGETGQVDVDNTDGTADAPLIAAITGPLPAGFEVSAAGRRLRYEAEVPAGQTITINTATGTVLIEGTADRRQNLTIADWLTIPAGKKLTLQFTSLGGAYSAAARLAVTAQEANW